MPSVTVKVPEKWAPRSVPLMPWMTESLPLMSVIVPCAGAQPPWSACERSAVIRAVKVPDSVPLYVPEAWVHPAPQDDAVPFPCSLKF